MKALTVRQPWAWAIAVGLKNIENRRGVLSYRGPVLVHAGQQLSDKASFDTVHRLAHAAGVEMPDFGRPAAPTEAAFGAVIAITDLVSAHRWEDCRGNCSPWAMESPAGHHRLANTRGLTRPVPAFGNTILWTPDEALCADVRKALL